VAKSHSSQSRKTTRRSTSPLMVRLDAESEACLARAAELRRISVSDYIRIVALAQARREVDSAREQTIRLAPDEQITFWNALRQTPKLTAAPRQHLSPWSSIA
jgi:uncharacterized protein (DUF1778 family)